MTYDCANCFLNFLNLHMFAQIGAKETNGWTSRKNWIEYSTYRTIIKHLLDWRFNGVRSLPEFSECLKYIGFNFRTCLTVNNFIWKRIGETVFQTHLQMARYFENISRVEDLVLVMNDRRISVSYIASVLAMILTKVDRFPCKDL